MILYSGNHHFLQIGKEVDDGGTSPISNQCKMNKSKRLENVSITIDRKSYLNQHQKYM